MPSDLVDAIVAGRPLVGGKHTVLSRIVEFAEQHKNDEGAVKAFARLELNRMERGSGPQSATQEVRSQYGIPVVSIATLDDLTAWLERKGDMAQQLQRVRRYRSEFGVSE